MLNDCGARHGTARAPLAEKTFPIETVCNDMFKMSVIIISSSISLSLSLSRKFPQMHDCGQHTKALLHSRLHATRHIDDVDDDDANGRTSNTHPTSLAIGTDAFIRKKVHEKNSSDCIDLLSVFCIAATLQHSLIRLHLTAKF